MPWPTADFDAYVKKAAKDPWLSKHPYRDELVARFADQLELSQAQPLQGCPSKGCRRRWDGFAEWVRLHSPEQLAAHILTAEDDEFTARKRRELRRRRWAVVLELIARWEMGEWRPGRRGDFYNRRTKRPGRTWVGYRTK